MSPLGTKALPRLRRSPGGSGHSTSVYGNITREALGVTRSEWTLKKKQIDIVLTFGLGLL